MTPPTIDSLPPRLRALALAAKRRAFLRKRMEMWLALAKALERERKKS